MNLWSNRSERRDKKSEEGILVTKGVLIKKDSLNQRNTRFVLIGVNTLIFVDEEVHNGLFRKIW